MELPCVRDEPLIMVNWNGIKYFVHVAEVGNISVAASELGIVQPALSRHIRRLEEEIGAKLFDRLPRGMQLTDEGRLVLERCRRMVREFTLAKEDVSSAREAPRGQVSFGIPGTLTQTLVPQLLSRLRTRYPNVFIRVVEGASQALQERLMTGHLHAAILSNPTSVNGMQITPLVAEQLVVVMPAGQNQLRRFFTLIELVQTPLIISVGMRDMVNQQIRTVGKRLKVEFEVDSVEAIRSVLLSGTGTTILPLCTLRAEVEAGLIETFPVSDINIHRTLAIAHRTGDLSPAIKAVIEIAQSEVSELAARGAFTILPESASKRDPARRSPAGKRQIKPSSGSLPRRMKSAHRAPTRGLPE
jgi:LysR family nitrogen assimilation transcriptional regulator